ncbi:MAG: creatininase family protein [Alphaproteobacteria bacterium]
MTGPPRRYWEEMTTQEVAAWAGPESIAILPVGAIEQHGPHLPLGVDSAIAAAVVKHAVAIMAPSLPAVVLPQMPLGYSREHGGFAGTLSLSAETLAAVWREIGGALARTGVRKLVLLNGHGGNPPVMDIVARDLRAAHDMIVVVVSWLALGLPDDLCGGLFTDEEVEHGIHGGAVETSAMLYLQPDLVQMDKAQAFASLTQDMAKTNQVLTMEGPIRWGWMAQDLNEMGVAGNAKAADAAAGRQVIDHAAQRLVGLLEELDRLPLSTLRAAPTALPGRQN